MRTLRQLTVFLLITLCIPLWVCGATQQRNTLPDLRVSGVNDTLQTFLRDELPSALSTLTADMVVSGGTESSRSGLNHTIAAVEARVAGYYVSQAATAHTYTASTRTFVYVDYTDSRSPEVTIAGCAVSRSTRLLFVECASGTSEPTQPTDTARLLRVDTSTTAITGVQDLRNPYGVRLLDVADILNVKELGATGNGTTDDTYALQQAINIVKVRTNGGAVYLPPGRYRITDTVSIDASNVTLFGEGDQSIIYVSAWSTDTTRRVYLHAYNSSSTIENVHFRHFKFLGEHDMNTPVTLGVGQAPTNAIEIGGPSSSVCTNQSGVSGVTFEKVGGVAITFNGGSNPPATPQCVSNYAVRNTITNSARSGINAVSGGHANVIVAFNAMERIRGLGIEWASGHSVLVGNTFRVTQNSAISVELQSGQTGWTIIAENSILEAGNQNGGANAVSPAIQLHQSAGVFRVRVIHNTIQRAYGQGIILAGTVSQDVVIEGNTIDCPGYLGSGRTLSIAGSNWAGIEAQNNTRVVVRNNVVRACTGGSDRSLYGVISGGTGGTDYWTDGNVTMGTFSTAAFLVNSSVGRNGAGTRSFIGRNIDLQTGQVAGPLDNSNTANVPVFTNAAATPSVAGFDIWFTGNSGATTITNLTNGSVGQRVTLICGDANTTLSDAGTLRLNGAFTCTADDTITLVYDGANWFEVARSVN